MSEVTSLAKQLVAANRKKAEIDQCIKGLKQKILDTPDASSVMQLIHNQGGSSTKDGITYSISRKIQWDQELLDEVLELIPREEWPPFVTQQITYKVDNTFWNKWAIENPTLAVPFHRARSVKLGDPSVEKVNADKLKEED
jgi:hypothetical protein